jgi:FixJ family two-component response regulator
MAESVPNPVELDNARLDERRRRSIRKKLGLLSEREPNVVEVVDAEMRNQKAIQVVFDDQVALENAPQMS